MYDIDGAGDWTPPSEYTFGLNEISDDIFNQDNICSEILGSNSLCSNDDFAFMNSQEYAWTIVDLTQPFFKYKDGFFENPDSTSGEYGFYTSIDSTKGDYAYSYIDYLGTTEYKWKVTAYNRWWDYNSIEEEVSVSFLVFFLLNCLIFYKVL